MPMPRLRVIHIFTLCDCQLQRLWTPEMHALIMRKQRLKIPRAYIRHIHLQRKHARMQASIVLFEAYVGAMCL